MASDIEKILESSNDPKELVWAAQTLASSPQGEDQRLLLRFLESESFLDRLDSKKDYQGPSIRLRLARVLKVLSRNKSESARATFISLIQKKEFIKNWARAEILIQSVKEIRPAPQGVIKFWDDHCQSEDVFMHLTIQAVVENGTEPAIALLEKKMADPRFEEDDKLWWMRTSILTHRNDLPLLRTCEQILLRELPQKLHLGLVESLFTYKPDEWYGPDHYYVPPSLREASPEALDQLRKIGELALKKFPLEEPLKKAVEKTLEEIKKQKG